MKRSRIGGCWISGLTRDEIIARVDDWISEGEKGKYITAVNVSKLVMMQSDAALADCLVNSSMAVADGFPVYAAARLMGHGPPERITGIDMMEGLLDLAGRKGYRVYFLGAKKKVLDRMVHLSSGRYPGLRVSGQRDGYFDRSQEEAVVRDIARAGPDILLVALGLPQKEYFVNRYLGRLNAGVILPVGGAFDVCAGMKKRAPAWVQRLGVEWLWRSVYDPTRAGLILKHAPRFMTLAAREIARARLMGKRGP